MYLFLSSRDSLNQYPNNLWYDFTTDFPGELEVDETWECALLDINCIPQVEREFVVFADIVKQNYIRDTSALVLRVVYYSGSTFTILYYIPVNRSNISQVRIYIRDLEIGKIPTESVGQLNCTLGFRKKKQDGK